MKSVWYGGEETFRKIESGCLKEAGIESGDKCDLKYLLNVFCLPDAIIYLAFKRKTVPLSVTV